MIHFESLQKNFNCDWFVSNVPVNSEYPCVRERCTLTVHKKNYRNFVLLADKTFQLWLSYATSNDWLCSCFSPLPREISSQKYLICFSLHFIGFQFIQIKCAVFSCYTLGEYVLVCHRGSCTPNGVFERRCIQSVLKILFNKFNK